MTAQLQLLRLVRGIDADRPCCENLAAINPRPDTIHAAELRCVGCGKFRGWMPREALTFLNEVTQRFGAPTAPLVLRDSSIGDHVMMNKQRENSGILFRNDRKEDERHPDYKGSATIAGVEYELAGWIKQGAKAKFLSLAVKPKNTAETKQAAAAAGNDFHNDTIPF
jgi:hypothetical protein